MQVIVVCSWATVDESGHLTSRDDLWKFADLPSLPPVGSMLGFQNHHDGGIDLLDVCKIAWCEDRPQWFEIETKQIVVSGVFVDTFRERMGNSGWKSIESDPDYDLL